VLNGAAVSTVGETMGKIIRLPSNFIGKEDGERLESFGGHSIAHGRATRWHWDKDAEGNDLFEIYHGGVEEVLLARVSRDRQLDAFCARDAAGWAIASGPLEQVLAELDAYLVRAQGSLPGAPA
jgi:hypothetical protein